MADACEHRYDVIIYDVMESIPCLVNKLYLVRSRDHFEDGLDALVPSPAFFFSSTISVFLPAYLSDPVNL